ncbi:MAG: hypothetical protein ACLUR5_17075 [Eubacterium ventriosum]
MTKREILLLMVCRMAMEYTLSERKPADGYVTASDIKFRLDKMVNDEGEVTTKVSVMDENGNYVNSNNNKGCDV